MKELAKELIVAAETADPHVVVVYYVPLLVEASVDKFHPFDLIAVMHADAETRIDRPVRPRGYEATTAQSGTSTQLPGE